MDCINRPLGLINRSVELVEVEDGGSKLNGSIVSSVDLSVSESDEGVDSGSFGFEVPVTDGEEGAHNIDIDEHTVVLLGSGDMIFIEELSLVEVVPVLFTIEGISKGAFGLHVINDVESSGSVSGSIVSSLVDTICLIKAGSVSSDGHCSVFIDDDHVFIRSEVKSNNEGIDVNGIIVSSTSFFETVSESDESVDLELLVVFSPCGDDQEGANNVSVDGEEEDSDGRINASLIEGDGISQIVPVFFLEKFIDFG